MPIRILHGLLQILMTSQLVVGYQIWLHDILCRTCVQSHFKAELVSTQELTWSCFHWQQGAENFSSLMDAEVAVPRTGAELQHESSLVDGVPNSQMESWFREADAQSKGYITPAEAVTFFKRTSLAKETLSKVVNPNSGTSLLDQ